MSELPKVMQAVVATPGGARATELREVPVPEPEPSEALVAVRAFAVNRGELSLLAARGEGWRPGQDLAGEVVRAAAAGGGPQAGARVAGLADWHGWAQYAAVRADRLAVLPGDVSFAAAAALPMAGTTALNMVRRGGSLLGRRVLITGASGGVGGFAVQLAALAGAHVTAVARPEHAERLARHGAAEVLAAAGEAAEGSFDLVLESVGGPALADAFGDAPVAQAVQRVVEVLPAVLEPQLDMQPAAGQEVEQDRQARAGLVVVARGEVDLHARLAAGEGGEVERRRLTGAVPEDDHDAAGRDLRGKAVLAVG